MYYFAIKNTCYGWQIRNTVIYLYQDKGKQNKAAKTIGGNNMRSAKELYENNYDFIQDMIKEHKSVDYIATAICEDIPDNDEGNTIYYELCEYIEEDMNLL